MKLDHFKIDKGVESVTGTESAERFHLSGSNKNAPVVTIDSFELGVDKFHYEGRGKTKDPDSFQFSWVDSDDDGEEDDLQIDFDTGQIVVLTDLAQQIATPVTYRFDQGFETDTAGWLDSDDAWFGDVTRVASGTDGIDSASGDFHAVFTQSADTGPFTRWGGYEDTEYKGAWTTSAKIYLDADDDGGGWAAGEGFDYSSAASGQDGAHQRDFIFHVTQDTSTGELLINASNNTNFDPREDLDTLAGTAQIDEDGWYTFQHYFHDDGGALAVTLSVIDDGGATVFEKTLSDPTDLIATEVGGNRYGWFTNIDIAGGIEVDDTQLRYDDEQVAPLPDPGDIFF